MPSKFIPIKDEDLAAAMGTRLKAARNKAGLSLRKMAEAAGVAERSYCEWEAGARLPRLDSLIRVCNLHRIPIEDMIAGGR